MKKIIAFILAVIMTVSAFTVIAGAATVDGKHGYVPGDATDDRKVDIKDVITMRCFIAGIDSIRDINFIAADVDGNNSVDMKDVLSIRYSIAGIETLDHGNDDGQYDVSVAAIGGRNLSRFSIRIPENPDSCMDYSAKLLKQKVASACGITMNIIYDNTPTKDYLIDLRYDVDNLYDLGTDGYHVKVEKTGNLTVDCGTKRAPLYAVYYILEKLMGYRFLNGDVNYLYKSDYVDFPDGYEDIEVPVFEYRGLNQLGSTGEGAFAALHLNAVDANISYGADNAKYGGGVGNLYLHGHSYEYQKAVGSKLDEAGITDLDSKAAMDVFNIYGYNTPQREALHLEVEQPCLTDEDTFRWIMNFSYLLCKAKKDKVPGVAYTMLSCSPNDNINFCTCPRCKAIYAEEGSIAGTVFRLSNRVAEAVSEQFPGVGVFTIAYWDARNPPAHTRPSDDVCVCFCIGGCNNHTYDRVDQCEACGGNSRLQQTYWDGHTENSSNVSDIDFYLKWAELTNNLYVWYYSCNFYYYISPCPNILNIYNDYKYLASTGAIGVYTEGPSRGYTFETLRGYLASRMMWDPFMTEEEFEDILDEALMIYFGDGWKYIKEYIYMQDICGNLQPCFTNNFDRPWNFYNKDYYRENFDYMLNLFNQAYDATTDEDQRERIELARVHVYFLGLSATYDERYASATATAQQKADYKKMYSDFWNYINDNGYIQGSRNDGYKCVDLGYNGVGGLKNFPSSPDDVRDTMTWVDVGFHGFGAQDSEFND